MLLALQLASRCAELAQRRTRDRLANLRLMEGAILFEHIACGFLHCAALAAIEAEVRKQVNPWKMGKTLIHPEVARELFVHDCIEFAAEHEHKIFIAHPLVFSYLHELFWPRPRGDKHDEADEESEDHFLSAPPARRRTSGGSFPSLLKARSSISTLAELRSSALRRTVRHGPSPDLPLISPDLLRSRRRFVGR